MTFFSLARFGVLLFSLWGLALVLVGPVQGQEVPTTIDQRVQRAKHGPDQAGKDGPMAKVGSGLIRLYYQSEKGRLGKTNTKRKASGLQVSDGYVAFNAVAVKSGEVLRNDLEALGLEDGAVAGRLVSGRLPITAIEEAASLSTLHGMHAAVGGGGVGDITSQGDVSMQTDQVRSNQGVDGAGVKVCVLSDSYNTSSSASTSASDDIQSGDLPGTSNPNGYTTPVDVLSGGDKYVGSDEGRAMLQIIHDVAPGAELGFHTALPGPANFAEGISELADPNNGDCDVIVDDFIYGFGGMLQDGVVADSVKAAVNKDGKVYLTFAGNAGDRSYESAFRGSGQDISTLSCCSNRSGEMHDFKEGSGTDVRQRITLGDGRSTNAISLQWSDPLLDANSDLDLFLLDAETDTLVESSEGNNVGGFAAESLFQYTNTSGSPQELDLVITLNSGEPPKLMKWVGVLSSFERITIDEYHTNSGTSYGHRNVSEAITVGAAAWFNTPDVPSGSGVTVEDPPVINEFSSKGGVPIYFDENGNRLSSPEFRSKPDITAPDGGNTTFFGADWSVDSDSDPNFFGTSAAAPHAAGVVALMLDRAGGGDALSASEVKTRLQDSAIDILERSGPYLGADAADKTSIPNGTGDDIFSGAGLIQADAAAPLPVNLAAFEGQIDGTEALLTWQTAGERQNSGFVVQHRRSDADFQEIGFVEGNGTTATPKRYRFRTDALDPGRHTFRLKQVDADGTAQFSESIELRRRLDGTYQLSGAAPNPARKRTTLSLTVKETQKVRAAMYNALGQRVKVVHDGRVPATDNTTLRISDQGLASGIYFVKVEGETFSATRKVVWVR